MKERKSKVVNIRVSALEKNILDTLRMRYNISISEILRAGIEFYKNK
jgi:hypothetical protein